VKLNDMPDMLRVGVAADILRISRTSAYGEVAAYRRTGGKEGLPSIAIGRCLRIPKKALLACIDAQMDNPNAA